MTNIGGMAFRKVGGESALVGQGRIYTYTVYVEEGIEINRREFAAEVDSILADKRGWTRGNKVGFKRVADGETQCILATPNTVDKLCAPLDTAGEVSCQIGTRVVLNLDRWLKAVPHWDGRVKTYRQMVVNHEFGHRIGKGHGFCSSSGTPGIAPVMQQQTYGLQGCRRNSWPLTSEL